VMDSDFCFSEDYALHTMQFLEIQARVLDDDLSDNSRFGLLGEMRVLALAIHQDLVKAQTQSRELAQRKNQTVAAWSDIH